MICSGALRLGSIDAAARVVLLLVSAVVWLSACAGSSSAPPQTLPTPPATVEQVNDVADLLNEAEAYFSQGEDAYNRGEYEVADDRFQRALDVYLDANIATQDRDTLHAALINLFNRIHVVMSIDGLIDGPDEFVSAENEELPSPSAEDLADLHARLEASPPELPKFSMPVPSPLENERVEWALAYLSGARKEVIEEGLSQATRYMPMIQSIFDEVGIPRELGWTPLIESLFKTGAYSRAAAVGMWQFVSGTARLYNMKVGPNVDERRDPVIATRMAAIYMRDLYDEFQDWSLVIAAYNAGKGRIGRAMQRTGVTDFWTLSERRAIPRETRDHVPKIYAAILMGNDPEFYGLKVTPLPPYVYDESVMEANTDLRLVADLAGLPLEEIRELNPHIMAWVPEKYPVRIPAGSKQTFETALAEVPKAERIAFLSHVVVRGDTLSDIAGVYGTRQSAIVEVNNLSNPNRLSIGQRLIIPVGPESRPYRAPPVAGFNTGERTTYRVQRGDQLWGIAQNFRTTVSHLMRWNDLGSDRIYPGDTLIVYYGVRSNMTAPAALRNSSAQASTSSPPLRNKNDLNANDPTPNTSTNNERGIHTVRRGDNFSVIAQRYDVTVDQLKRWNDRHSNTIYPGDKLVVFSSEFANSQVNTTGSMTNVQRYIVRRGDSPYEIAQRYGVGLDALLVANGLSRRSNIYPGDELQIPGGRASSPSATEYTVRRGDTLSRIAENHGISLRSLLQTNELSSRSIIHPGDQILIPRR